MESSLAQEITMNLKTYITTLLLFASAVVSAQQVWTLDECVAYAIKNNLQINDFELNTDSNKESYRQSVRNLLPIINGFADYSINFGRSINPENNRPSTFFRGSKK